MKMSVKMKSISHQNDKISIQNILIRDFNQKFDEFVLRVYVEFMNYFPCQVSFHFMYFCLDAHIEAIIEVGCTESSGNNGKKNVHRKS